MSAGLQPCTTSSILASAAVAAGGVTAINAACDAEFYEKTVRFIWSETTKQMVKRRTTGSAPHSLADIRAVSSHAAIQENLLQMTNFKPNNWPTTKLTNYLDPDDDSVLQAGYTSVVSIYGSPVTHAQTALYQVSFYVLRLLHALRQASRVHPPGQPVDGGARGTNLVGKSFRLRKEAHETRVGHCAALNDSLGEAGSAIFQKEVEIRAAVVIPDRERFYALDQFGNHSEFTEMKNS